MDRIEKVIAGVESNFDKYAMRFEEKVYFRFSKNTGLIKDAIKQIKNTCQVSNKTAIMIASTSWGLYQIMGYNLYTTCNLTSHIIDFLNSEEKQKEAFYTFCNKNKISLADAEKELAELVNKKQQYEKTAKTKIEWIDNLKKLLTEQKEKYKNLITFIRRYNGASFLNDDFLSYLLRMIYYYEKIQKGGLK